MQCQVPSIDFSAPLHSMSCFIISLAHKMHAMTLSLVSVIPLHLEDNLDVQFGNWICLWDLGNSHRCWRENGKAEIELELWLMYMPVIQNEDGSGL